MSKNKYDNKIVNKCNLNGWNRYNQLFTSDNWVKECFFNNLLNSSLFNNPQNDIFEYLNQT